MQAGLFSPATTLQRLDLEDAEVDFMQAFYSREQGERHLELLLAQTDWRQETLTLWGKQLAQPRLTAWYGETGQSYSYSGLRLFPLPWTPLLFQIKQDVESLTADRFNSVLLNLYRDQHDSVSWHSDDETELGAQPVIVSVSLGATRTFRMRHKRSGRKVAIDLSAGCLLRMAGNTQRCWKHAILKESEPVGPRINLTFRRIRS